MLLLLLQAALFCAPPQGGVGKVSRAWILGVVRTQAGDPIEGAVVTIRFDRPSDLGSSDMPLQRVFTRRNGTFTQAIAGEGYFEVCASTPESRQCQTVEVEKSKDTNVSFDF